MYFELPSDAVAPPGRVRVPVPRAPSLYFIIRVTDSSHRSAESGPLKYCADTHTPYSTRHGRRHGRRIMAQVIQGELGGPGATHCLPLSVHP